MYRDISPIMQSNRLGRNGLCHRDFRLVGSTDFGVSLSGRLAIGRFGSQLSDSERRMSFYGHDEGAATHDEAIHWRAMGDWSRRRNAGKPQSSPVR
jgi:hypothetical protein